MSKKTLTLKTWLFPALALAGCLLPSAAAATDVRAKLNSSDGSTAFQVRDANDAVVGRIDSLGHALLVGSATANGGLVAMGASGVGAASPSSLLDVAGGSLTVRSGGGIMMAGGIMNLSGAILQIAGLSPYAAGIYVNPSLSNTTNDIGVISAPDHVANALVGLAGFLSQPEITGGTVENLYHYYATDSQLAASVTNEYGLFLEAPAKGTSQNYSIFSQGGTLYHGGGFGLGTSTPSSKLDLEGGSITVRGAGAALRVGATNFVLLPGGWAGLGTSAPQAALDIADDSTVNNHQKLVLRRSGAGDVGVSFQQNGVTSFGIVARSGSGNGLAFLDDYYEGSAGTELVRILSGGNMGIGTNAPSSKLDVAGGSITVRGANAGARIDGVVQVSSLTASSAISSTNGVVGANMVYLIDANETDSSSFTNTGAENTLLSFVLPPNDFKTIIVEAEVAAWNYQDTGLACNVHWKFYEDTTVRKNVLWRLFGTAGGTAALPQAGRDASTIKTSFPGGQTSNTTLSVAGQLSVANAANGMLAHSFRVYGVK